MKVATQFSISLINKPGTMSQVIEALAKARCDISCMTLVDVSEHGTLRLVFNSDEADARKVLQDTNAGEVLETEVLALTMDNRPGAIAAVATKLGDAKVNIQYAYVTAGAPGGKTTGIFKVSDTKKAMKVLSATAPSKRRDDSGKVKRLVSPKSRNGKVARR